MNHISGGRFHAACLNSTCLRTQRQLMDLPTCPACGQSVLDDDVDDCPFCGASLSGKPAAAPAAAKAAPTAVTEPPKTRPKAAPPAAAQRAPEVAEPAPPTEDDPFELERSAEAAKQKQVVKLHERPAKGRSHKVVCPMCEGVGYTARKAAGRDVRCVNPDCQFPVFTAPPLAEGESISDEPGGKQQADAPRTIWTPLNIGITAALAVAGIGAIWFFGFRETTAPPGPPGNGRPPVGPNPPGITKTNDTNNKKKSPDAGERLRKLRARALTMMVESAQVTTARHLLPLLWQWVADANAQVGDRKGVAENIGTLRNVASSVPHFIVQPLVTAAWRDLKSGDEDARKRAGRAADDALKAAANPPALSRGRYDAAAELGALLLALGRDKEAGKLLADNGDASEYARLSAFLHRVRDLERYDADAALMSMPIREPRSPVRVSVVFILAARGQWQTARTFARSQPPQNRAECLTAWHEASAALQDATEEQRLKAIAADAARLSPAELATVYARVSVRLHRRKLSESAAKFLAAARKSLPTEAAPTARTTPSLKEVMDYAELQAGTRDRRINRAAAFAEVGLAAAQIDPANPAEHWKLIAKGLAYCRSLAAPASEVRALIVQTQRRRPLVQNRLNALFNPANDDEKRRLFLKYQSILVKRVKPESDAGFALQSAILSAAMRKQTAALLPDVWRFLNAPAKAGQQDWFASGLPSMAATQADRAGNTVLADEINKVLATRKRPDPRQLLFDRMHAGLKKDDPSAVATMMADRLVTDSYWKNTLLYAVTTRLVNAGRLETAVAAVRNIDKAPFAQPEAFRLLAARAVTRGKTDVLWKQIDTVSFSHHAKVALCRGLVEALEVPEKPAAKPAESAKTVSTAH